MEQLMEVTSNGAKKPSIEQKKDNSFFMEEEAQCLLTTNIFGNSTSGSEEIRLMTKEEALEWCEERSIKPETIQEAFGEDSLEEG